jgi:hypothetical protein
MVSLFAILPPGSNPLGLAFDDSGNLYTGGISNDQIYKITSGGAVSLFATLTSGSRPTGLAFDSSGNLYVADSGTGQISKISSGGTVSLFATLTSGFTSDGLAFDSGGNLYAADGSSGQISKITSGGAVSLFATTPTFNTNGLAFDGSGNLYAADYAANQIYKITSGGAVSTFASVSNPDFIAIQTYSAQVQQPINLDGSSVFSVKRGVVPVKFTLTLNGVATCQLPPATISLTRTAGGVLGSIDESTYLSSADSGSNFRIDSTNCQYIYNLATSSLGAGEYTVSILIGGSVVGSGTFGLK